jgi:hypothetical protein
MLKRNKKYIITLLGFVLSLALLVFILNKVNFNQKEIKNNPQEQKQQQSTIDDTLVDVKIDANKEQLYNQLNDLFINFGKIADVDDLEKLAEGSITLDEMIPEEYNNSLYFYDTYSSYEDKSLAYQAIISISYLIKKENYKLDENQKKIMINKIALDEKKGIASVPLSLYSKNLSTSYIDMVYDDGQWKPVMKNLVNEIKLLDYVATEYIEKEE